MRRQKIQFKGIVRSQSEQLTPEGACEELINLRNEGGLKAIGAKRVLLASKTYTKAIEHITADFNNLIVVMTNKVYIVNRSTGNATLIHTCPTVNIELATLNNMLIINCLDASKMVVYQYKSSAYSLMFNGFPAMASVLRVDLEPEDTKLIESTKFVHIGVEGSTVIPLTGLVLQQAKEQILAALVECRNVDPEFCEGYILVCTSYTLIDGTETKMSPPTMFKLATYDSTPLFQTTHGSGNSQDVWLKIQSERLYLTLDLPADIQQYSDIIKYVNIYCSRPISYYKDTQDGVTVVGNIYSLIQTTSEIAASIFNEALFENELMYKQHRIDINKVEEKYQIKFGDTLLTGKTMPVDSSGWVSVVGKPFVYNNRLHLFDLRRTLVVEQEVFTNMTTAETLPADATSTAPSRVSEYYFSVSTISKYNAWELATAAQPTMPVMGEIWYDSSDGNYYTTESGSTLVDPGWYLVNYGVPYEFSVIREIRIGEIVPPEAAAIPTITTSDASNIGTNSVDVGGNATSDGGTTIMAKGIVWATHNTPTLADNKTSPTSGTGVYNATISGLSAETKYYFRAYATNNVGTAYGTVKSFDTLAEENPEISRTEILTYGQGNTIEEAFGSEITGSIWQDVGNDKFYTTKFGSTFVSDNYYILIKGADIYASQFILIENGIGGVPFYPQEPDARINLTNYGFHGTSWEFAFLLESPGTAYFDSIDNKYYSTAIGSTLALEGFYVVVKGTDQHDSEYIFINQYGAGEYFYPPATTTEEGTTSDGTTYPNTTEEPPAPEPITCNGFDAYEQSAADTRVNSNNYNTRLLYIQYIGETPYAYTTDEYTTFAQAGYYAVGEYVEGVTRRIQIGDAGVILYDSDGTLTSIATTTSEGTTSEGTTSEPRLPNPYFGYSATNASDCYYSNLTGTVYADVVDNKWYTTAEGMTWIADGWWMFEKNSGPEDSLIYEFLNGEISVW